VTPAAHSNQPKNWRQLPPEIEMNYTKRPKLHLPLALLAAKPATRPVILPPRQTPFELRHMVAAMVD
jgi:hypothetical protein